jgi:hypothetical protein
MKIKSFALDSLAMVNHQFAADTGSIKIVGGKTRTMLCLAAIVVLALCTSISGLAQTDPFVGTWKMSSAKSKFTPGPAWKSETRIVEESPKGMKVSVDRTNGDGTNQQFNYTTNFDGASHPVTGIGPYGADSVAVQMTAWNTLSISLLKSGKVVGTGTTVVSPDGKTLTLTSKGTDEKGKASSSVVLFDKQ